MAHLCFATYEIAPTTKGGTGVLLRNLIEVLLADGHDIVLVLDLPPREFQKFVQRDRLAIPGGERIRSYHVGSLVEGLGRPREDEFLSHYQWRAHRFYEACRSVADTEQLDVIEFFDYGGVAHYALSAKVAGLGFGDTQLVVRLHTSLGLMDRVSAETAIDLERVVAHAMEGSALRLAERVLYPTPSFVTETYLPNYDDWFGDLIESPPPIVDVPEPRRVGATQDIVLFYGRLSPLKGVDLFIAAALAMLAKGEGEGLYFYLVGFDPSNPDAPHLSGANLKARIPEAYQSQFVFTGQWSRSRLTRMLPRVRFAVFPTRLESFGYAAHELKAAGVPLIVSPIPAFRDYFTDDVDVAFFDGTVEHLCAQMVRLDGGDNLLRSLANSHTRHPHPVSSGFYASIGASTWITNDRDASLPSLLVCVLADGEGDLGNTLGALDRHGVPPSMVVVCATAKGNSPDGVFPFLGRLCTARTGDGRTLVPASIMTSECLLVLRAGDLPHEDFLKTSLNVLGRQSEIDFVGCWHQTNGGVVDTFPMDLIPEAAPFLTSDRLSRCVVRTEPDRLLIDVYDANAGALGDHRLISQARAGIVIPSVMIDVEEDPGWAPSLIELGYLVWSDESPQHWKRLREVLAASWHDRKVARTDTGGPYRIRRPFRRRRSRA